MLSLTPHETKSFAVLATSDPGERLSDRDPEGLRSRGPRGDGTPAASPRFVVQLLMVESKASGLGQQIPGGQEPRRDPGSRSTALSVVLTRLPLPGLWLLLSGAPARPAMPQTRSQSVPAPSCFRNRR